MRFYADLHIHSSYSRATSKDLNLASLTYWAQLKGITLVGTGDCIHPAWLKELNTKLERTDDGLYTLSAKDRKEVPTVPSACAGDVRFLPTTEISCIYKRGGKVRKVHNLIVLPAFEAAQKLQRACEKIGNIHSDGRPILGLDSRDLLEMVLEADSKSLFIPAHIWTPWFSMLGSKSGFDSVEECFGDLTKHIHALETGLSSDPPMNWRLSQLDPFVLISNSDAHSASKLGRECTFFDTKLSYESFYRAITDPTDAGLGGTLEFFPHEGKYHYDGHMDCKVRLHPHETIKNNGKCPVCHKPVTVGVMSRVDVLADRPDGARGKRSRPFVSCIPLAEIIGDAFDVGPSSKKVSTCFNSLLNTVGNEFFILLTAPIQQISACAGPIVAEGVRRARSGQVEIAAGFDGQFGTIKLFTDAERKKMIKNSLLV